MRRLFELRARRSSAMASHPEALESLRLHREGGALEKAGGFGLHWGMFMPTIDLMGTDAQRAKWLPLARSCAIVGTYAQTELGHGTNLSALETTATYDAAAGVFVLETPTVTATKWWPGGLGKTTTHAVVMARLLLHGVDRGQHAFVVQLRDLETHAALQTHWAVAGTLLRNAQIATFIVVRDDARQDRTATRDARRRITMDPAAKPLIVAPDVERTGGAIDWHQDDYYFRISKKTPSFPTGSLLIQPPSIADVCGFCLANTLSSGHTKNSNHQATA